MSSFGLVFWCIGFFFFFFQAADGIRVLTVTGVQTCALPISGVAFLLFAETMYRRHPYRLDTLGTAGSVATMTPDRLDGYRSQRYPVGQATLSVVGDVDPDRVSRLLRERLGRLPHPPAP